VQGTHKVDMDLSLIPETELTCTKYRKSVATCRQNATYRRLFAFQNEVVLAEL
jgi:hypothetical protein